MDNNNSELCCQTKPVVLQFLIHSAVVHLYAMPFNFLVFLDRKISLFVEPYISG